MKKNHFKCEECGLEIPRIHQVKETKDGGVITICRFCYRGTSVKENPYYVATKPPKPTKPVAKKEDPKDKKEDKKK